MRSRIIGREPARTLAVIFETGEEVTSGLLEVARSHNIASASLTAIGAFSHATLAFFNLEKKEYEPIPIREQVEVLSLLGNIALHDSRPKLHAHVVVGTRDGSARGGHLMKAFVRPTLEVILVESTQALVRRFDEQTGLPLIIGSE